MRESSGEVRFRMDAHPSRDLYHNESIECNREVFRNSLGDAGYVIPWMSISCRLQSSISVDQSVQPQTNKTHRNSQ